MGAPAKAWRGLLRRGQVRACLAEHVLELDLPVLEGEDVDAVGLDAAAVGGGAGEGPLRGAEVAVHEVHAVDPLRGIGIRRAAAKALRTASVPVWRVPQASGPAAVWNTQSSLAKLISASMSWRFQAALKAARVSVVTGGKEEDMALG